MNKRQTTIIPADWQTTSTGRKIMDQAVAQHLTCYSAKIRESEFSKWTHSLVLGKMAMELVSADLLKLIITDMFAKAVRRYLNYNPKYDVRGHVQTLRWSRQAWLDHSTTLPSECELLEKHHDNAPRQAFVRTLGYEMLKFFDLTEPILPEVISNFVAIVHTPIKPSAAKEELVYLASLNATQDKLRTRKLSSSIAIRLENFTRRRLCLSDESDVAFWLYRNLPFYLNSRFDFTTIEGWDQYCTHITSPRNSTSELY